MQTVTQLFIDNATSPLRNVESRVLIDGVYYDDAVIVNWDIQSACVTDNDMQIGAAVSSVLNLEIRTDDDIAAGVSVQPFIRFVVNEVASEWLSMGVFYVDSRTKRLNSYRFKCFDGLIFSQRTYFTDLIFPNTMHQVIVELTYNLGITVSATFLSTLLASGYAVPAKPADTDTFRHVLSYVASSHGGNLIMNRDGELDMVVNSKIASLAITDAQGKRPEILAVHKSITLVAINVDSEFEPYILGVGDTENIMYNYNPYVTQEIADSVFAMVDGIEYDPIRFGWTGVGFTDVGDRITYTVGSTVYETLILSQKFKYGGGLSSTIEAPSSTVQQSELGFGGSTAAAIAQIGQRIGLFAWSTNTAKKTIKQSKAQVCLMPLTIAGETDIEFVVTVNGIASLDSTLTVVFKTRGIEIGRTFNIPVRAGANFVSFSTLVKRLPKMSDWLFCNMKIENGSFIIEKEECEFYIYGGNIVSGNVRPILEFEDLIPVFSGNTIKLEGVSIVFKPNKVSISASDSITSSIELSLENNLGGVDIE